jgi:AcrR family transcriptional regulator
MPHAEPDAAYSTLEQEGNGDNLPTVSQARTAPPKLPRRNPAEVRRLLLEAAERVVTREGARRATATAIAREAGVSSSGLYRHFQSREDLLQQAIQVPLAQFMKTWHDALPQTRAPADDVDILRIYITAIHDAALEHRGLIQTLLHEFPGDGDLFETQLARMLTDAVTELEEIGRGHARQQGIDEAVIPSSIRAITTLTLLGSILGPAFVGMNDTDEMLDFIARFSVHGIRQKPERPPKPEHGNESPTAPGLTFTIARP